MLKLTEKLKSNPWLCLSQSVTLIIITLLLWGTCIAIFGKSAVPGSQFFQLAVLFISAKVFGSILHLFFIPAIFGQMFMGALLANIGYLQFGETYNALIRYLRKISIANILLPGTLGLHPERMKTYWHEIILVTIIPAIVEFIVMTLMSVLLIPLPWSWGFILGLIISSPPPAIIIGCFLDLEKLGFGYHNGINLVSVSGCIINDVINIAIFDFVLDSIIGDSMSVLQQVCKYTSVLIGIVYGATFGIIGQFMPHPEDFFVVALRTVMLASVSLFAIIGSNNLQVMGAGIIGCVLSAFIACLGWRRYGWDDTNPVRATISLVWKFVEPISFSLIGIEVKLDHIDADEILYGSICIILCTIAAIGPLPLERVQLSKSQDEQLLLYAAHILTLSVLSILLTAPIGAFLMLFYGPRLLKKEKPSIIYYGNPKAKTDDGNEDLE